MLEVIAPVEEASQGRRTAAPAPAGNRASSNELAEAVQLSTEYIDDLIAGRRRRPLPGRTDLYERMTSFLRLSRNDLALCASAERADTAPTRTSGPKANVRRLLLALCEPGTARELEERRAQHGSTELVDFIQRLLQVTQGAVRRMPTGLRLAAERCGGSYVAMRLRVLEFLDATPETLTVDDFTRFLRPRVELWDVDLQTGVLRVVLRGAGAPEPRPAPAERRPGILAAGRRGE